ncbi:MAG: adenylyl-sulfate kinase [Betaproteobacteria bacterium]|nr:adenylyl-sulfate kinase [Betaproteobacteria bacterium]
MPEVARILPDAALLQSPRRAAHAGGILWLTGLSGAGKTTLGRGLEHRLMAQECHSLLLDGDEARRTLSADLGFSAADRSENIRRAGAFAAALADAGVIVIAAFISPYRADRDRLRAAHGRLFCEVWLSAGLAACEQRDVKGLYARARRGEIAEFTGVSAPYEAPLAPELTIDTGVVGETQSLDTLTGFTLRRFDLPRRGAAP